MWSDEELDLVECALQRMMKRQVEGDLEDNGLLPKLMEELHACRSSKASQPSEDTQAQVAMKAVLAAANAAQAAADSVSKNTEMVQLLLDNLHKDGELSEVKEGVKAAPPSSKRETKLAKIAKEIRRQNIWTHCILGFMVLTTAIWRYKEISFFFKFRKLLNNPLEAAVGGIFGGGHEEHQQQHKFKRKEELETKPPIQLPQFPQIFQKNETTEASTTSP